MDIAIRFCDALTVGCIFSLKTRTLPLRQEHAEMNRPLVILIFSFAAGLAFLSLSDHLADAEGFPHDWSHQHLIFSAPRSPEQARLLEREPRYRMQQLWRRQTNLESAQDQAQALDAFAVELAKSTAQAPALSVLPPGLYHPHRRSDLRRDWSENMGAAATVGGGQYPAKYSFSVSSANCASTGSPDFVVFNTGLPGSAGQATVVAFDNLYSGCSGTVPSVFWAYQSGTGSVPSSIVLSADGSKVAFVENPASGGAILRILKWESGEGTATNPKTPTNTYTNTAVGSSGNTAWSTCPNGSSCMISVAFQSPQNNPDSASAPFYDYANDVLYVGDNNGYLHQFAGVFLGTPAELTTGGFPSPAASVPLSSPVYDPTSGLVLVSASYDGAGEGARIHEVDASNGAHHGSSLLGPTTGAGMACPTSGMTGDTTAFSVDAPIVDSSAEQAYIFVGSDGNGNSRVFQFLPGFAEQACGHNVIVGSGSNSGVELYAGTFDNIYFTSTQSSDPSGNLYVCGNPGAAPTLYEIPISSNAMRTPVSIDPLTTASAICSPVTEFYNTSASTDYIFLSVQGSGATSAPIDCPANTGCAMSFNVTSALANGAATSATLEENGGTSGIIIDNSVGSGTLAGTSQVYFSSLGGSTSCSTSSQGCAVQASQAGLN
jgi:hypothetical protein